MKEQETQEMQVMLKDQQDVSVQMNERLLRLEAQKSETKDYSAELAHISGQLERLLTDETLIGLKDSIRKQAATSSNLVTAIGQQQAMQETMIKRNATADKIRRGTSPYRQPTPLSNCRCCPGSVYDFLPFREHPALERKRGSA